MNKVTQGLDKIKDLIKSETPLTAQQQIDGIYDIIYELGMTRDEIEELAEKTNELKQKVSGIERFNVGGLIAHILTYKGIDELGKKEENPVDPESFPEPKKPIDPKKNPEGVYGDDTDPDFKNKDFKNKGNIRTRGQKIKEDSYDYGKEYPESGEIKTELEVATNIINNNKGLMVEDKKIIETMIQQGATRNEIIQHMEKRIQEERREINKKKNEWSFNRCIKESYDGIKEYLEKIFGKEISEKLNELPDISRIHLAGTYDFLDIAGAESACGIFRTKNGDIYVSADFLRKYENEAPLGKIQKTNNEVIEFPRIFWEIKHIVIHEALHGMSVLNYKEIYEGKDINTRRIGLKHINQKQKILRGVGINEGTTENLTQKVLEYIYKEKEGLTSYQPCRISYIEEQIIIKALQEENPDIKRKDFYKAMILRKYGDEENIKGPTPLVELIRKTNEGKEIKNAKNPYFFQIIMDLLDYINLVLRKIGEDKKQTNEEKAQEIHQNIELIVDFIKTKDISLLQNYFRSVLDIVFNTLLLNKTKTNFNETILNTYTEENKIPIETEEKEDEKEDEHTTLEDEHMTLEEIQREKKKIEDLLKRK